MYTRAATADDDGKNYLPGGRKLTFKKMKHVKNAKKRKQKQKICQVVKN